MAFEAWILLSTDTPRVAFVPGQELSADPAQCLAIEPEGRKRADGVVRRGTEDQGEAHGRGREAVTADCNTPRAASSPSFAMSTSAAAPHCTHAARKYSTMLSDSTLGSARQQINGIDEDAVRLTACKNSIMRESSNAMVQMMRSTG